MKTLKEEAVTARFPTSVTQKRCWVMEQIQPGNKGLNLAIRWELRGAVTGDIIEAAFQKIVDRHEILRTRFVEQDGDPVQEVVDHVDFRLDRFDIRNVPEADQEDRIRAIALDHAAEPFDLGQPCLLRVAMVQFRPDRAALLISVHNSVFDGYSIGVLGHEMGTIAAALIEGREPDLPDLPLQYGDYAMWLKEYEESGAMAEEERYWLQQLGGMPYFEVPPDRPRSAEKPEVRTCARDLPQDFDTCMAEAAKALDVSVFALSTAATSAALERFTGRGDVSFAIQVAGRNDVDLESLIGIFTNPIVLRFDIRSDASLKEHVLESRRVIEGALAHQSLPFDKLVQKLNPKRDPLRIPLVSVMFNMQRAFLKELDYGPFELRSVQSHSPGTLYDLSIAILGRNSGWRLVIDYNAKLFDEATAESFADMMLGMLEAATRAPERRIAEVPVPDRATAPAEAPVRAGGETAAPEKASAAGGEVKARLAGIWSELLAIPEEAVDGDFFDLGGFSVLALRMLAKAGDEFGTRPSLYEFLADPTLSGLASLLEKSAPPPGAQEPSEVWSLIELRPGEEAGPVLVTVNQTFLYQSLARDMTSGCTVANLAIPSHEALKAEAARGFDAAMEEGAEMVRAKYHGRPLLLCGLCVDGRAALRLAQALEARGESVATVAMIDSWAPGAVNEFSRLRLWRDKWAVRMRRLSYFAGMWLRGKTSLRDFLRQYNFAARLLRLMRLIGPRPEMDDLIDATVAQFVAQSKGHRFSEYPGEAMIFVTEAQGLAPKDGVLGWSDILPADTAVFPVRGWHGDALMRSGFERIVKVLDEKASRLSRAAR
jgi:thioesterase domain-containing protein